MLTCPDGRFALTHVNNWQHAAVYPPFLLAGVLDWAALGLPLPPGLQQVKLLLPKSRRFNHQITPCTARFDINVHFAAEDCPSTPRNTLLSCMHARLLRQRIVSHVNQIPAWSRACTIFEVWKIKSEKELGQFFLWHSDI